MESLETRQLLSGWAAHVNFEPAGVAVPAGYVADTGNVYGNRGNGYTYGWNADNSSTARYYSSVSDPRYGTFEHMQKPSNPNAVWQIAVPNGTYSVHIASGDPAYTDSVFKINAEGVLVVNGQPTNSQHWVEGTATVSVTDGELTVSNTAGSSNNKIDYIDITSVSSTGPTPFHGTPFNVSTATIQAEDFDNGGEGISYHDTTPNNIPGNYRNTAVDINAGGSNGYDVGYTAPGEWLDYTINAPTAGTYALQASVAETSSGAAFHAAIDGTNVTGSIALPNTGGWYNFRTVQSKSFSLSAGTHVLKIYMDHGDSLWNASGNYDFFKFVPVTTSPQPLQLTWATKANNPAARLEASAQSVGGKLYVFGGYTVDSPNYLATKETDAFDPATNTWSRLADMPEPLTHMGTATDGRYIYTAGGYVTDYSTGYQTFATTHCWRYDTQANSWSAFVPLPQARGAGAMVLLNGQLHYFDGVDASRTGHTDHWVLDLSASSPQWVASTPTPFSSNHLDGVVLNGKIYAVGGQLGTDDSSPIANVLVWDPAQPNSWQTAASLPQPRTHAATVVADGQILVMGGGTTGNYQVLSSIVAYNPSTNTWSTVNNPLPDPRLAPAAGLVGNLLVITTGDYYGLTATTWEAQVPT